MDQFNDKIRAMFETIGNNLTKIGQQILPKETNVKRDDSKASRKTTTSLSKASHRSRQHQPRETQVAMVPQQPTVYAPYLLPSTSTPAENPGMDQHWFGLNAITNEHNHCAAYLLHCTEHNKVALTKPSAHQALWMPFTPIPPKRSWQDNSLAGLLIILSGADMDLFLKLKEQPPFIEKHLLDVFQIQLPHTLNTVTRLIWYVSFNQHMQQNPDFKCCKDTAMLQWIDQKDLDEQNPNVLEFLWGNEPLEKLLIVETSLQEKQTPYSVFDEYSLDIAFKYAPNEQQLLSSANLSEKDVERLFGDFLAHCFPSASMTQVRHFDFTFATLY